MSDKTGGPAKQALHVTRSSFAFVGFFSCFINLMMLTAPLYMLQIYDRVLTSGSQHTLVMLTVVAIGMIFAAALLEFVRSRVLVRVGIRLDACLNVPIFGRFLRSRLQQSPQGTGQPLRDLESLRSFLTGPGLISFFDAPWTPIFLAVIFLMHPILGFVALAGAFALLLVALLGEVFTRKHLQEAAGQSAAAHGFAESSLRNAEVIEAMGMLPALQQRWLQRHRATLASQALASDRAGVLSASAKFIRPSLQIGILGAGAYLALQEIITPGVMIAASILMGRALAPVEGTISHWRNFVLVRGAYGRLKELLSDGEADSSAMRLPRPKGDIRLVRCVAAPPGVEKPVIKGLSFALSAGESLGVIGPSAAGKSTLARLLVGIWAPSAGHVRLDGADIGRWDHSELGPYLGYLPQDIELFDGTVAENISRFGQPDPEAVVAAARRAGVHELILSLPQGYDTQIGEGGARLSGGQRQRIGLARAFYGQPALVVLDEPNSNLDSEGEEALRQGLLQLKKAGATVIVIAHRPSVISIVEKLLVLKDGKIEHFGARDEVLAKVTKAVEKAPVRWPKKAPQFARPKVQAEGRG